MKKICIAALCLWQSVLFAQSTTANRLITVEPAKRFIENKSQFDGKNNLPGTHILYAVDHGAVQIYFTNNGFTCRLTEKKEKDEQQMREIKRKIKEGLIRPEDVPVLIKTATVHLEWLNASPSATLTGLDETSDYFSYAVGGKEDVKNINHIKGFERLIYKNLYPQVDVEYAFHPQTGIKYNIILHPGADVSKIKMNYTGAEKITLDENGNIRIATALGDIVDHAPLSFYEHKNKKTIATRYVIEGNTVSFALENFNVTKTVVIDPWVVTPAMPVVNKVYYVKTDDSGNAYAYGGDAPYRLQKYNAAGALQWTYNTPWSAANTWFGGLITDPAGNSIITAGTGVSVSKINASGSLVWTNSPGNFYEYWAPVFNCDYSQLLVGGTYLVNVFAFQFHGAVFDINVNSGALNGFTIVANTLVGAPNTPPFIANEVRSICASPNGNYYYLTLDTVGSLSQSFAINYGEKSGYNLSYYLPYGQGGTGQGVNAIAATPYFIYTSNGQVLHKRDITNGNLLSTVFIPSGAVEVCSGIAVDSCGNVYAGSVGRVVKYDANLNLITTATVPAEVYDVSVGKNGEVIAAGSGFIASLNMSACNPVRTICETPFPIDMQQTNVSCNGACDGTATATPSDGVPPYSYFWSNGETTPSIGNLCAGAYAVTITDAVNAYSIASVRITEPDLFTVSVTSTATVCGTSAIATPVSGVAPYAYSWSNGSTEAFISGLATGTYSVTVFDGNSCSATGSISVTQTPGLTAAATAASPSCGACDGSATAVPQGGNPPFAYQWSNGDTTETSTGICPGVYSVTISETTTGGNAVFWSENFTSGSAGWTLNANSGSNGSSPNQWVVNNNRASGCLTCPTGGSGGNYLHITCDGGSFFCTPQGGPSCVYGQGFPLLFDNTTDRFAYSPNISTIAKSNITLTFWYVSAGDTGRDYGLVRLSNDGGNTWTDLPQQYAGVSTCTQAVVNLPQAYENIPNFRIGFRWINDNDLDGNDPPFMIDDIELSAPVEACSAIASVIVNSDGGAEVTLDSVKNVSCKNGSDGAAYARAVNGAAPYRFAWSTGDTTENITGLSAGTYFVTVTDADSCITIASAFISEPAVITITGLVTNAGCNTGGNIDITVNGGTAPYSYLWTNSATSQDLTNVQGGAYIVTVTDANNCTKSATFNVSAPGIFLGLNPVDGTCGGANDGSVISSVLGGSPPYAYIWSTGDTTVNLTNIPRGTYSLTVTDNSGCAATKTAVVFAPDALDASASITRTICQSGNEGGIKLNPSGGVAPYEATWGNGLTGLSLTDLAPGVYEVTVTDDNGCTLDTFLTLTSISQYSIVIDAVNASCDGAANGSATAVIVSGNTPPYTYTWNTGAETETISNLAPGVYIVTVEDTLNCQRSDTVEIIKGLNISEIILKPCPGTATGSIITSVSGGESPYSYSWNTGAASSTLANIPAGVYSLTVSDRNDCRGNETYIITDTTGAVNCDSLILYDVFSPNGDGRNDIWIVDGLGVYPENELQIFNRWGSLVYEARPYLNNWDGRTKKGEPLPPATYYYILKLNNAAKSVYSGHITLVR